MDFNHTAASAEQHAPVYQISIKSAMHGSVIEDFKKFWTSNRPDSEGSRQKYIGCWVIGYAISHLIFTRVESLKRGLTFLPASHLSHMLVSKRSNIPKIYKNVEALISGLCSPQIRYSSFHSSNNPGEWSSSGESRIVLRVVCFLAPKNWWPFLVITPSRDHGTL